MKVVALHLVYAFQRPELFRADRRLSFPVLHDPFDDEAVVREDRRPLVAEEVGTDDRLREAGLVLERQEDESLLEICMRFANLLSVALFAVSVVATATACPSAVNDLAPDSLRVDGRLRSVCTPVTIDGRKLFVAAYSDGGGGYLAVVTDEARPVVVARSDELMVDIAQAVELHDFTGDGRPEFVVKYVSRNDVLWWIFAFDPAQGLRLLSPSLKDDEAPLANAEIIDVDGDGRDEVMTVSVVKETDTEGLTVAHPAFLLYTFRDGKLRPALDRQVFHYSSFARTKAKPQTETVDVHVPRPGVYRVTLLNGIPGLPPCTSGGVAISGKSVFTAEDFKRTTPTATVDVQLQYDNLIDVKLTSAPSCGVALIIDQR